MPVGAGQRCPPRIGPIGLPDTETARLTLRGRACDRRAHLPRPAAIALLAGGAAKPPPDGITTPTAPGHSPDRLTPHGQEGGNAM